MSSVVASFDGAKDDHITSYPAVWTWNGTPLAPIPVTPTPANTYSLTFGGDYASGDKIGFSVSSFDEVTGQYSAIITSTPATITIPAGEEGDESTGDFVTNDLLPPTNVTLVFNP